MEPYMKGKNQMMIDCTQSSVVADLCSTMYYKVLITPVYGQTTKTKQYSYQIWSISSRSTCRSGYIFPMHLLEQKEKREDNEDISV